MHHRDSQPPSQAGTMATRVPSAVRGRPHDASEGQPVRVDGRMRTSGRRTFLEADPLPLSSVG